MFQLNKSQSDSNDSLRRAVAKIPSVYHSWWLAPLEIHQLIGRLPIHQSARIPIENPPKSKLRTVRLHPYPAIMDSPGIVSLPKHYNKSESDNAWRLLVNEKGQMMLGSAEVRLLMVKISYILVVDNGNDWVYIYIYTVDNGYFVTFCDWIMIETGKTIVDTVLVRPRWSWLMMLDNCQNYDWLWPFAYVWYWLIMVGYGQHCHGWCSQLWLILVSHIHIHSARTILINYHHFIRRSTTKYTVLISCWVSDCWIWFDIVRIFP